MDDELTFPAEFEQAYDLVVSIRDKDLCGFHIFANELRRQLSVINDRLEAMGFERIEA